MLHTNAGGQCCFDLSRSTNSNLTIRLGYRLATTSIAAFRPGLAIAAIRLLGGALAALLFVLLLAPSTPVKQAVLLNCFMPCAVQTFMLSAKFSRTSDRAAAGVFISTAAALFYIPFLIAWLSALS